MVPPFACLTLGKAAACAQRLRTLTSSSTIIHLQRSPETGRTQASSPRWTLQPCPPAPGALGHPGHRLQGQEA